MKINKEGLELIKSFEGCKLKAYKPVATEKYYTIGYGHYDADVTENMKITQETAEKLLKSDLAKFEEVVNKYQSIYNLNENQFSALVSFTYNCGAGNLELLTAKGTRTVTEISEKILLYNKASGKVLAGLTRRRKAEKQLFDKAVESNLYYPKFSGTTWLIDKVFKCIGAPYGSVAKRRDTAIKNGCTEYTGKYCENMLLVKKAKEGKLLK